MIRHCYPQPFSKDANPGHSRAAAKARRGKAQVTVRHNHAALQQGRMHFDQMKDGHGFGPVAAPSATLSARVREGNAGVACPCCGANG